MIFVSKMLTGEISMKEYLTLLESNVSLQQELRDLMPKDAVNNPQHPLWKATCYENMKNYYNFDLYKRVRKQFRFDDSIGDNLNIFGAIEIVYKYSGQPEIKITSKYDDAFNLYLDVVKDCFDGPEVKHAVFEIMEQALLLKGKAKQRQYAKEKIKTLFHAEDGKSPRWIQGAEWPMGKNSPMKFLSKTKKGELVSFEFVDVDTAEKRTVVQYY